MGVGQDLAQQVENETDSVALLPKVVGLLFVQVNLVHFHSNRIAASYSWL